MIDFVYDPEAYFDEEITLKKLGYWNYFAQTDYYLVSVAGPDFRWVGHPLDFDFSRFSNGGHKLWSHNAGFDRCSFLARGQAFPCPEWNCSSNLVAYLGAPRSLKGAAKHLLGVEMSKDTRDKTMKGRAWSSFSAEEQEEIRTYALRDAELSLELVRRYAGRWPEEEQQLSQHTILMSEHGVYLDASKLKRYIARAHAICEEALPLIPWRSDDPGEPSYPLSLPRTREHCLSLGIEPPASFAEKSAACRLWELTYGGKYPFVAATRKYRQALFMLRRLEAMLRRRMPGGRMNYDFRYAGCHTLRWAGGGGVNMQNLRKVPLDGIDVRSLIVAASGKELVCLDLSSIEPRCLGYLVGDQPLLDLLRGGTNFYEAQAQLWGMWSGTPGTLKLGEPQLYALLKSLSLGCGYGMGAQRFRETVASQLGLEISLVEARRRLGIYRMHNPRVVALWNRLDYMINMSIGAGMFRVELPSGRWMGYNGLHRVNGKVHCMLATSEGFRDSILWGGSLVENITQAFARDVFAHKLLMLSKAGLRVILHTHDEYLLETDPDVRIDDIKELINRPVEWAPGLPIASDAWKGGCYAKR